MKIVILGAGITGVTTAYFLAKAGHEVTVLEKNSHSAMGCSYANGGQLSFSNAEPWCSKSSLFSFVKSVFNPHSFVTFSDKKNKEFYKWAWEFIKNSREEKNQDIESKLLKLGSFSKLNLDKILQDEQINFDYKQDGILHFYRSEKSFEKAKKKAQLLKDMGVELEILNPYQCTKKEPTLSKLFDDRNLSGGIFFKNDASGNAAAFVRELELICKNKLGVVFEYNAEVKNIFTNNKKITGINSSKGVFAADNYISTLGSYGNSLLKGINVDTKIYPIKGYSLSIPTNKSFLSPSLSLSDPENKMVYSKLGNIFRAAGILEICGLDNNSNQKNIDFIKSTIKATFSDFGDLSKASEWHGFRPFRPNCLPLVCKIKKYGNLFINSGHGSLGWTICFATAKITANMVIKDAVNSEFAFLEE